VAASASWSSGASTRSGRLRRWRAELAADEGHPAIKLLARPPRGAAGPLASNLFTRVRVTGLLYRSLSKDSLVALPPNRDNYAREGVRKTSCITHAELFSKWKLNSAKPG